MVRKIALMLCLLFLTLFSSALANEEPIGFLFKDKIKANVPVKIYIKEVAEQSGQGRIAPEIFKKALEESLLKRRSIKFTVVNNEAESDIRISAIIKNYQYLERGPFKPSPNIGATLADAAATGSQNYAEIRVEYTVSDTKSNNVLWNKTINEYLKKKMTAEESVPLICDVVTRAFIWKCFGKANLREPGNRAM